MNTIVIVGDKFESFSAHTSVMQVETFEALLRAGAVEKISTSFFELGQGVGADRINALLDKAEQLGVRDQLLFERLTMCGKREVHKHSSENAIISIPLKVKEDTFESLVFIDDSGELFSDHVTGQHLPGMVFVEAVRQLCLGVTETHFMEDAQRSAFLLTSIHVRFLNWAFPLAIKAVYRILTQTHPSADAVHFAIDVTFVQGDKVVASGDATFELRNRRVVSRHEHLLARVALAASSLLPQDRRSMPNDKIAVG